MMLRKALVLGTACTMMLCSGAVFAQDIAQTTAAVQAAPATAVADFTTQLAVAPENAAQLIADAIVAANGNEAAIEAILAAASNAGVEADVILASAVSVGVDPSVVAQVVADTQTAAAPAALQAVAAVAPVALPAPGAPGFGGGGGGGGGTISGN